MKLHSSTIKELLPFAITLVTITVSYMSTNANNENHFTTLDDKVNAVIKNQDHMNGQLDSITLQMNDFGKKQAVQEIRLTTLEKIAQPYLSKAE